MAVTSHPNLHCSFPAAFQAPLPPLCPYPQYRAGVRAVYDTILQKMQLWDTTMGAMSLRCNQPDSK